jgi:hypothetical protein
LLYVQFELHVSLSRSPEAVSTRIGQSRGQAAHPGRSVRTAAAASCPDRIAPWMDDHVV